MQLQNPFANKRHSVRKPYSSPNVPRSNFSKSLTNSDYYELDNFDNPNSWLLKELDMLDGMGFKIEGSSHMGLTIPGDVDLNKYEISKHKKLGYELKVNERKHYFKSFQHMMDKIDEFGKLEI